MKPIFTFFACLLVTNLAKAQCSPAPTFSVTNAKAVNQPLRVKATITTGAVSWPLQHNHYIKWGDGSSQGSWSGGTWYHSYMSPGTYTVKYFLTKVDSVTSSTICYDSTSQSITVAYCAGAVSFTSATTSTPGQVNFTGTNLAGTTTGVTYAWDFGDASTGSGLSTSHTYSNMSPKTVSLYGIASGCTDTARATVYPTGVNCAGDSAFFYTTINGLQVAFNNTSTPGGVRTFLWNFGDGTTSTQQHPTHTYSAAGTYLVRLKTTWDSTCVDSASYTVTVTSSGSSNVIKGYIVKDSAVAPMLPDYKVWLIVFDSASNTLSAVDSLTVTGNQFPTLYQFNGAAAGKYRVKAALTNGPTSGTGYVPTYGLSSLSWSTASIIYHYGGTTQWHNINMQSGTITGGPGFVGGNVSLGANKGTGGSGVSGMDVYLVDVSGKLAKATKTDANGDYSFTSVPEGTYQIQPEWMGYRATSSTPFAIGNGRTKVENMWFTVSNSKKTITPTPASVTEVAADMSFNIYPNPAKNKTTIQWNANSTANAAIIITDLAGKTVYSNNVNTATQTEIDLSQLGKGLYFINVSTDRIQQTQKLVVE